MTASPSRLLTVVAVVLVALLGVEPGVASADSLGGVVPRGTTFELNRANHPPRVVMADNFTTAGAVDGRVPESRRAGTNTWTQVRGKWATRNGYLDPPQLPGALVVYPADITDLTVEMGVTIAGPYNFGPVLRANAAGTSFLAVQLSSSNTLTVTITVAGTTSTLLSRNATQGWVSPTGVFTFGATLRATTLEVRLNGAVVLTNTFTTTQLSPLSGLTYAGVWVSSSGNEMLDDVRVTEPM
ncbi:MAG: hypothetical protein ACO3C1_02540 [Ilumatobacteraceae bacterium]